MKPWLVGGLVLSLGTFTLSGREDNKDEVPKVDLKKMKATVELLDSPVTIEFIDTPFADVVKFLEAYTQTRFSWDYEILPDKAIRIHAENQALGESLQVMLTQCKWRYAVRPDGEIMLQPIPVPKKQK